MTDLLYIRNSNVTSTSVDGTLFLIATDSGEIVHLDPMATALWAALEDPKTRSQLLELFGAAFPDVSPVTLADDIDGALGTLQEAGLLSDTPVS